MLSCHFPLSKAGESPSSTWKCSMFFYQSKTHSTYLHKCFIFPLLLLGIVKRQEPFPECFLFWKLYLPFQIKYKFSSFELHNQFWVEWNVKTSLFFFPRLFVSIFIFRHNAKICGSGRTWSSRSCQNQCGPGRGTALKAWVICSTCPRSTSKTGPQRWALNEEVPQCGCRVNLLLAFILIVVDFFSLIFKLCLKMNHTRPTAHIQSFPTPERELKAIISSTNLNKSLSMLCISAPTYQGQDSQNCIWIPRLFTRIII